MTNEEMKTVIKEKSLEGKWVKYMNYFDTRYYFAEVLEQTNLGVFIQPTHGRKHIRYNDIIEILEKEDYPEYYI